MSFEIHCEERLQVEIWTVYAWKGELFSYFGEGVSLAEALADLPEPKVAAEIRDRLGLSC